MDTPNGTFPLDTISLTNPVQTYTPSNPAANAPQVRQYIESLPYQHDLISTLHITWVLLQMPEYMREFPYLGVPLNHTKSIINKYEALQNHRCKIILGFQLDTEVIQTLDETVTPKDIMTVDTAQELVDRTQASMMKLIDGVELVAFQYNDETSDELEANILYVDNPDSYDYFVYVEDSHVLEADVETGKAFLETTSEQFTEHVAGILHFKAEMIVDTSNNGASTPYQSRFIDPFISSFATADNQYNLTQTDD